MMLSQKFFNRKQAHQKVNHCSKNKRKGEKGRAKKRIPKIEKPKDVGHFLAQKLSQNFDFCACPSHNALKSDAGGKKGKLLCCKCIFHRIKGNLAEIQPKNHQNVQKWHFLGKVPGVNGLINSFNKLYLPKPAMQYSPIHYQCHQLQKQETAKTKKP